MFCVPACIACTRAGSCPKGELPALAVRTANPPVTRQKRRARAAVIERELTPYIHLVCTHITTRDEQELYSVFQPKGGPKYFCEQCGKWRKVLPKPAPEPLPEEPLF